MKINVFFVVVQFNININIIKYFIIYYYNEFKVVINNEQIIDLILHFLYFADLNIIMSIARFCSFSDYFFLLS